MSQNTQRLKRDEHDCLPIGNIPRHECGAAVLTRDGYRGVFGDVSDPHNIEVVYDSGGNGFYCDVPGCFEYDPVLPD